MQEASVAGFIRTLFYIVVIYFILKFLARLFFPIVMKKMVQKAEEQMRQQYQNQQDFTNTTSKTSHSDKPKETKKVGEYIDYEEVD